MAKYEKPKGFRMQNWRQFTEYLSEKDIENLEKAEKMAQEDLQTPCPYCGGQKRLVTELSTMITRCINPTCGYTHSFEFMVLEFKD